MLSELRVKNLAIVDDLRVVFRPGLNVVTGETGAGKSILIGALDLVLGARSDRSAIRAGELECRVEALFALPRTETIDDILTEAGAPVCEDGQLLVRRTVVGNGAGRVIINDAPTTVQTLRRIGEQLVDIHGAHDRQSLLDPAFQRDLLDAFGGLERQRESCARWHAELRLLAEERARIEGNPDALAAEIDLLRFQMEEIEGAALSEEDESGLTASHAEAANAERLIALGSEVAEALTDGDTSAFSLLVEAQHGLSAIERLLPDSADWLAEARAITLQLQELSQAVAGRIQRIDADPTQLERLEARMTLVQNLKRKYGGSVAAALEHLARARRRLDELEHREERLADIDNRIREATQAYRSAAETLGLERDKAAVKLTLAIARELAELGFARCEFHVERTPCSPGPSGSDAIAFAFAPNVGEPMRPLRVIASSGEISRVMLALKTVLAEHDRIPVLVFDEIDANIGGETGHTVGVKMGQVAHSHQVICITHLPQVAAHGAHHLVVRKDVEDGRTLTRITEVDGDARVEEITRMLGGADRAGVSREHARALLNAARGDSDKN